MDFHSGFFCYLFECLTFIVYKPLKLNVMRVFILFFSAIIVFSSICLGAETRTSNEIAHQPEVKKHQYRLTTGVMEAIVINMQYGESEVISTSDRNALKTAEVVQIDVVFSDYPKRGDMTNLNLNRIRVIERLRKELVTNPSVEWRLIRQMACKNETEAKTLFHGIVIHYRSAQSKVVTARDMLFMENYLPKEMDAVSAKALKSKMPDSTIFKVFDRNKSWNQMHVVADLTGSMSPYTAQLVIWFQLNMKNNRLKQVTFFNDGDGKSQMDKKIGQTGGIYMKEVSTYDEIRELAIKTMSAGNGGDGPENDIEALIAAAKQNPNAKEFILIADNLAPVKDLVLLGELKIPVRVVLCGTHYGINTQYLTIARATGGSVHTMEEDLHDLFKLSNGKTFTFQKKLYKIDDDRIVEVTPKMI